MSAVTASLCSTLLFFGVFVFVSADQKNITAVCGQDTTLTCRAPNNKIMVVKWNRADLGDEYVLLSQDGQIDPDDQHPSFKNRVDLQDRQMKDGDVSLILKDVMMNDTGTYECAVRMKDTDSWKLNLIHLHVVPPGQTGESVGVIVGLTVVAILVSGFGVLIWVKKKPCKKCKTPVSYSSADDDDTNDHHHPSQ